MGTQVSFDYECEVFRKGDLKLFSLKLARFCDVYASDSHHFIRRKEDGFETSENLTVDEIENIESYTPQLESIGFHCKAHIIILSFKYVPKYLHITYILDCDVAESKKLIFFIENTLGLKRFVEGESDVLHRLDNSIPLAIDTRPNTDTDSPLESTEDLPIELSIIWGEATLRLRVQMPEDSYQTWLDPLIPSIDGKKLILCCQNEFAKIWLESRYHKMINETVQSIDPSIEEISFQVLGKSSKGNAENKQFYLSVDEPLFELMMKVYEKETENQVELTFEKYFNQVIQSHCQERMGDDQSKSCCTHSVLSANDKVERMESLFGIIPNDMTLEQAREERLKKKYECTD